MSYMVGHSWCQCAGVVGGNTDATCCSWCCCCCSPAASGCVAALVTTSLLSTIINLRVLTCHGVCWTMGAAWLRHNRVQLMCVHQQDSRQLWLMSTRCAEMTKIRVCLRCSPCAVQQRSASVLCLRSARVCYWNCPCSRRCLMCCVIYRAHATC